MWCVEVDDESKRFFRLVLGRSIVERDGAKLFVQRISVQLSEDPQREDRVDNLYQT